MLSARLRVRTASTTCKHTVRRHVKGGDMLRTVVARLELIKLKVTVTTGCPQPNGVDGMAMIAKAQHGCDRERFKSGSQLGEPTPVTIRQYS